MKLSTRLTHLIYGLQVLAMCASVMPVSATPIISVVGPASVIQGNDFSIDISVSDVTDLYAFQFDLGFDPSLLRALSITEGPLLPAAGATFAIPGLIDNSIGSITGMADSLVGLIPGANGNGILFSVNFRAIGAGISALTLSNELFLDSSLNDITGTVSANNGRISVSPGSAVPTPSTVTLLLLGLFCARLACRRAIA